MTNLENCEWRDFSVEELFSIFPGKRLETRNKTEGLTPFIGAADNNNGVTGFVQNDNASRDRNVLGVNYNGAPCIAFYHPYECLFSDDVKRLHLRDVKDSLETLLPFIPIFATQRVKYGYGYKFNEQRMLRQKLLVPIDKAGNPDYIRMATFVKERRNKKYAHYLRLLTRRLAELGHPISLPSLKEKQWGQFRAFGEGGLFNIRATQSGIDAIRLHEGDNPSVPYVTRSDTENGVSRFVDASNANRNTDGPCCLTIGLDTQTVFWQPFRFVTGQNIQIVSDSKLNKYVAFFLCPLLKRQMRAKFNWGGNGATLGRMRTLTIMLPINESGGPDFAYMEQFVKNKIIAFYLRYQDFLRRR